MKHKKQTFEPLAIVGMSCLFPKAQSLENYWGNIKEKIDAITEVPKTHWQADDFFNTDKKAPDRVYTKTGGFLDPVDFNPAEWGIAPSDLDSIDTSQLLSLVVAQGALADAGYTKERNFNRDNVSVVLGLTGTLELVIPLGARLGHPIWKRAMLHAGIPENITNEVMENIGKSYVSWQENSFPGLLGNVAAGRIANRFDLGGTNCVVDAACGSALSALNLAAMELWAGKSDMAITGGVDTFNDIFMYMCFCKTPALSPTGNARPFSEDNDGTILGEGIGMYVLKRLADAERDGDKIYALINAVSSSSDGKGKAIYAPRVEGQVKVLRRAYEQAGITPKDVTLIEAHGTGTGAGDEVEVTALKEVYGEAENNRPWCAIGSVKSQIGHTKAAAGSAGIIKAAMALHHKVIPPTIKISKPAKSLKDANIPFYLPDKIRPWINDDSATRYAAVSSLGFGGSNYHVVLSEYKPQKQNYDWPSGIELATISGQNVEVIKQSLASIKGLKDANARRTWAAETRKSFNSEHQFRLCFAFDSHADDLGKIANDIENQLGKDAQLKSFSLPNGVYFESENKAAPVGVIFPGQGSQYTQMGLDLNCLAPEAFACLEAADKALGALDEQGNHLRDYIYPVPTYDSELDARNEEKLRATDVAQPAIGSVSIAQFRLLEKLGLKVEGFAGHSYGELVSLCAAGAFDTETLATISRKRGELMAQGSGDRGGMIAVATERSIVEKIIAEENLDLVVANHNSPQQVVLSGKTEEITRSQKIFKSKKIRSTVLKVAGAFHSSFVADAAEPFYDFLKKQKFSKLSAKVYANTTADAYPAKDAEIKKLLGNQLANQVRFVEIIEKMYADGIRTFIEAGPGGKMVNLIKAILEGKDATILAVDSSAGKRSGVLDLARVIAQLSAMGYQLGIGFWQNGEAWLAQQLKADKPRLTFPVCGANYKSPALLKKQQEIAQPPIRPVLSLESTKSQQAVASIEPERTERMPQTTMRKTEIPQNYVNQNPNLPSTDSLKLARESLNALQMLQQQTADLHRRFLEGQEQAQNTIMALLNNSAIPTSYQSQQTMPGSFATPVQTSTPAYSPEVMVQPEPVKRPEITAQPAPVQSTVSTSRPVATENVSAILMEVVSEKTGYPADMLNLEMDMEADLGIDSIKRVEIMSAMQEKLPNAPVVQPDQLGKLRTLSQIIEHLGQSSGNAGNVSNTPASAATPAPVTASTQGSTNVTPILLEVVSEKTGYPADMLNLDMDMEADLGIDSIKRVEIMSAMQEKLPNAPVVQPDQLGKLRTLSQITEYLSAGTETSTAASAPVPNTQATDIQPILMEIVGEKTGYPADMLNLDMDMEADLGIDSIKRVEIMSAMQEKLPEAPVIQPDQLGKLRTLAQIIEFLGAGTAQPTPAAQAKPSHVSTEKITATLLEVVADKTGYPSDMLNPEMDMEADLGIDSIKRVEILSAFQEKEPEAPVVQPGDLGNFRTIGQIIEFLTSSSTAADETPASTQNESPVPTQQTVATQTIGESFPLKRTVLVTRELDETPAGQALLKSGDKVLVSDDNNEFSDAVCSKFVAKGCKVEKKTLAQIAANEFSKDIKAFILLAPLPERSSQGLWSDQSEEFLKDAFMATQKAGFAVKNNGNGLVATVSRMDGSFGLGSLTRTIDPIQGGLAGISKTITHEWPEVTARAIDLDYRFKDNDAASEKLVNELLVSGPVETGLSKGARISLEEKELSLEENTSTAPVFSKNDVIIVTGGARGVTAATAIAMAEKYHCSFALIGRSGAPEAEPGWLCNLENEAAIKEAILKNSREKMTPKQLEAEYKSRMANREILNNLKQIGNGGSKVKYCSADIRNAEEVEKVISEIRKELGEITGLIHGAGVLRDRKIEDKTRDQLDDVIDTKVKGLRNTLKAVAQDNLKAVILFSSFSGRFGRTGQVDYSMANEALNKIAHKLRILRPECRVLAFNWGPWDGGMVTPGLRNLFLAEGIGLIPLQAGAYQPVIELSHSEFDAVEIGIIGVIQGNKPENADNSNSQAGTPPTKKLEKAFDYELKLESNAWLKDHVINGEAVLPMAVTAEMLAHVATMQNPGLQFVGYDDLRILKGVVLHGKSAKIEFYVAKPVKNLDNYIVNTEIRSELNGKTMVNARAQILLAEKIDFSAPSPLKCDYHLIYPHSVNEAYEEHLFHGEFFRAIQKVEGWSDSGISAVTKAALPPENWSGDTLCTRWYSDPLAVDSAFQLMILWTVQTAGAPSLPGYAARYRQYCSKFPSEVIVRAMARRSGTQMATADIDFLDKNGQVLARMEGYECVINEALRQAFKARSVDGAGK